MNGEVRNPQGAARELPFPALVGLELAQQALMLLAIEPRLGGLVLAAPAGTGKTSLARGMRSLLDEGRIPFIEVPASVDIDNLLGGLDLEATLRTGKITVREGLLARADGGVAYVDGINLLTDGTSNLLLSVLDDGEVQVEREGISMRAAARFSLIGSYDPAEGMPRRHLIDRIGLMVTLPGAFDVAEREDVLRRNLQQAAADWAEDVDFLRGVILAAREILPDVTITDEQMVQLSGIAMQYGVEGHRVDLFAIRAACAAAASELREEVTDADMEMAARLVILPRATRVPVAPPEEQPAPPPPEASEEPAPEDESSEAEPEDNDDEDNESAAPPDPLGMPPEQVFEALASELPEDIEKLPFNHLRRGQSGSRGSTSANRGRHVRSVPGDPKRARIDVVATLRAAAPWQPLRARQARYHEDPSERVRLEMSDIRVKQYRSKAGALFCFIVDASGSMALHRMRQAKGAVHTLLMQAYVNRDRVALIAFRGSEAELLMPPTQSVELAKKALDLLPTGGGTPLASAIMSALELAEQAKMRGIMQTVLVILTDGRANVSLREGENPQEELQTLGQYVMASNLHTVVVDTKRDYLSKGEARQLAGWLGGDYAYLPSASGQEIGEYVANVTE